MNYFEPETPERIFACWRIFLYCKSISGEKLISKIMKYLLYININKNKRNQGFTLIELAIVMVIVGMLSAIALPNFLGQRGKARETDAKNSLGTIARSQQAYHFEKRSFADNINNLNISGIGTSNYYNYPNPSVADSNIAKHQAIALDPTGDLVRNFAVGVYQSGGLFDIALCQSRDINQAVDVGNTVNDNCTNSGIKLK